MNAKIKFSLAFTAFLLIVIGIRVYLIYRQRNAVEHPAETVQTKTPPDDLVVLKHLYPENLADLKPLIGKPLWVNAGGQMDFYPYAARHANYQHTSGTLLGADRIDVKDVFEQVAPASAAQRIPAGDRQVLLAFTRPNDPKEYAVPVGDQEGKLFNFFLDDIYFYDDPHQIYNYWPANVWAAIDRHQAIPGMSEHQVQLALGQVSTPEGDSYGNRSVTYFNLGKPIRVTFDHDKATAITPVKQ